MAPNLLGNALLIAETCIDSKDNKIGDNNNCTTTRNRNQEHKQNKNILNENYEVCERTSEKEMYILDNTSGNQISTKVDDHKQVIIWRNVIAFVYLHVAALYGIYLMTGPAQWKTIIFAIVSGSFGAFGVTAGAHRLWSHRSYKAKFPLRLFLMLLQTLAFQNSLYEWVRDHRAHHKFTDTFADPHDSTRGFFFSHIGWLMVKKHPAVKEKGKGIDMSDMDKDPIVSFQKKYYLILMPLLCFILPTCVPVYFFSERLYISWYIAAVFRYTLSLNSTWLVNSAAHIWGMRPYDKSINPTQNYFVVFMAFGEGWHNYHHVFPWDYKASEFGNYGSNITTAFIDLFSTIGWSYDLRTVSDEMIRKRAMRTGDGSHEYSKKSKPAEKLYDFVNENRTENIEHDEAVWGWSDEDMNDDDKQDARIFCKS